MKRSKEVDFINLLLLCNLGETTTLEKVRGDFNSSTIENWVQDSIERFGTDIVKDPAVIDIDSYMFKTKNLKTINQTDQDRILLSDKMIAKEEDIYEKPSKIRNKEFISLENEECKLRYFYLYSSQK